MNAVLKMLFLLSLTSLFSACQRNLSQKNYRMLQGVWYMADGSEFTKIVKGSVEYVVPYGRNRITVRQDTIHYEPEDTAGGYAKPFDELILYLDKYELKTVGLASGEKLHWVKKRKK